MSAPTAVRITIEPHPSRAGDSWSWRVESLSGGEWSLHSSGECWQTPSANMHRAFLKAQESASAVLLGRGGW